jgi:hypothetical protein
MPLFRVLFRYLLTRAATHWPVGGGMSHVTPCRHSSPFRSVTAFCRDAITMQEAILGVLAMANPRRQILYSMVRNPVTDGDVLRPQGRIAPGSNCRASATY